MFKTSITDTSATGIAGYTYDAFGNTETATGPAASANKYRFSTKPIDDTIPTNPLYYYGYRFYNPITGRWLNRDPIEEKGGLNLYGFVGNDGVGLIDYLGLCEEGAFKVIEVDIEILVGGEKIETNPLKALLEQMEKSLENFGDDKIVDGAGKKVSENLLITFLN